MKASAQWLCCFCTLHLLNEVSAHYRTSAKARWHEYDAWLPKWMKDLDGSGMSNWQRKLCKKMRRLSGKMPGLEECMYADSEPKSQWHQSQRDLKFKLQTEQVRSKHLQQELQKEKIDKKDQVKALEQQVLEEKTKKLNFKAKFEAKVLELGRLRVAKQQKEREHQQKDANAQYLKLRLESSLHELQADIASLEKEVQREHARANQASLDLEAAYVKLRHFATADVPPLHLNVSEMALEINSEKNKAEAASLALEAECTARLELLELLTAEKAKVALLGSRFSLACPSQQAWSIGQRHWLVLHSIAMFVAAIFICLVHKVLKMRSANEDLTSELHLISSERDAKCSQLSSLEEEFNLELGGMMKIGHLTQISGTDFTCHIFDKQVDQGTDRSIKIQCPGVRHSEVSCEIIFNGCIVRIQRQASRGDDGGQWERKFQFRPSEGLFEFREDQAMLDRGCLTLVFRAFAFQSRPFLFPKHFDLSETDVDDSWEYPVHSYDDVDIEHVVQNGAAAFPGNGEIAPPLSLSSGSSQGTSEDFEKVIVGETGFVGTDEVAPDRSPSATSSQGTSEDFQKVNAEGVSPEEDDSSQDFGF